MLNTSGKYTSSSKYQKSVAGVLNIPTIVLMRMLNISRKYTTGKWPAQYIRKMHQEECSINSENSLLHRLGKCSSESVQSIRKCIEEKSDYSIHQENAPGGVLRKFPRRRFLTFPQNALARVLPRWGKFQSESAGGKGKCNSKLNWNCTSESVQHTKKCALVRVLTRSGKFLSRVLNISGNAPARLLNTAGKCTIESA